MNIRNKVRNILPYRYRIRLKRVHRRLTSAFKKNKAKVSIEDMRLFLTDDLGIKEGDSLMVTSSFGNLNADFTPLELISLLQEIVGETGNIAMPFYPPGSSKEWAESGIPFDMNRTRSATGVLTQLFSEMDNVYKSKHPTKSVVAWGENAKEITTNHHLATSPFYWDSPYGWFLKNKSKSVGLGLKNIPVVHAIEDIEFADNLFMYFKDKYPLRLIDFDNKVHKMDIHIHSNWDDKNPLSPGDYTKSLSLDSYVNIPLGFSFCFSVDNQDLHKESIKTIRNKHFRGVKI